MQYTIAQIHKIIPGRGQIVRPTDVITQLLTDSRSVSFGARALFFAISGRQHNGHRFIGQAYREGVRNFVVEHEAGAEFPDANFLIVENSVQALQQLAAFHRQQFDLPVVGITGSNGKTIVKEWLYHLLKIEYDIVRSPKSYNSQIGVPLSVMGMDEKNELAIFEAGISQPHEMERLEKIIHPTIGIITNITDTHSEGFSSHDEKTIEKLKLFEHCPLLIFRKDHSIIAQHITGNKEIISWSTNAAAHADMLISDIEILTDETLFSLQWKGSKMHFAIPFIDQASFENAAHAIVAALITGGTELPVLESITRQAATLPVVSMRMEIKKGNNNCILINDTYSADIDSLKIALQFQKQQGEGLNKTIILTDFDESGYSDEDLYHTISELLAENNITRIIGVGEKINRYLHTFNHIPASGFKEVRDLIHKIPELDFSNEIILLKGARRFQLEKVSHLLAQKTHGTVLKIFMHHMVHNLNVYRSLLQPGVKTMAMVKAFSYGSGQAEVARLLAHQRVDYLAVAYADEGADLRRQGIKLPLMVMNPEPDTFDQLLQFDLEPEIYSVSMLQQFIQFIRATEHIPATKKFAIHIKLDTGMHRLGFGRHEIPELIRLLLSSEELKVASIFSHLAAADESEHDSFTNQQVELFNELSLAIIQSIGYPVIRHIVNSPGISKFSNAQFDMVRLGIGLYGVDPSEKIQHQLLPVSSLQTTISQIREIRKGDSIGYGRSFIANENMRVATINIGYADGFSRRMSNGAGQVYIHGHYAPVVGKVCMDMTMVNISGIPSVKEGDMAELFGEHISIQEYADRQGTIPYEVMTGISQRVKRVYVSE